MENAHLDNVVRLAEYRSKRNRRGAGEAAPANNWSPQYYCLRCDADEFKLYATGTVHCGQCGALMRNLLVTATPENT